jgi:fimbrial chaperone protein
VRIALRFSIPVFAEPEAAAMPDVRWQITRKGAQLYLIGNNMGAEHETIRKLVLKEADGKVIGTDDNASPHILAGAERSWRISATKLAPGSALRLTAETDGPSIDQSIRLPSGSP